MLTKESVVELHIMNLHDDVPLDLMNNQDRPTLGDGAVILILLSLFLRTSRDEIIFVLRKESKGTAIMQMPSSANFLIWILLNMKTTMLVTSIE